VRITIDKSISCKVHVSFKLDTLSIATTNQRVYIMIDKLIDVCFAVLIGLMLAAGALAYFDVLTK
jgi:hypothetical protein